MIETTLNVPRSVPALLFNAAVRSGVRQTSLISNLLSRAFRRQRRFAGIGARIRYQGRREDWVQLHVRLSPEIYSICQDMRAVGRISISRCFVFEVENHLEELIEEIVLGKCDNTRFFLSILYKRQGDRYTIFTRCTPKSTQNPRKTTQSPP